jgi:hypothetical protein
MNAPGALSSKARRAPGSGAAARSPLTDVRIAAHLNVSRTSAGWRVASDELNVERALGAAACERQRERAACAGITPVFQLRGALADADVALLQSFAGEQLQARFGAAASHVTAGRIADAHFALSAAGSLTGALELVDARVSDGRGLDAEGVDARIDWNDAGISAVVDRGHAGPLQLGPMQLAWRADGKSALAGGRSCHGPPREHARLGARSSAAARLRARSARPCRARRGAVRL